MKPKYFKTIEEARKNKIKGTIIIKSISPESQYPYDIKEWGFYVDEPGMIRIWEEVCK